MLFIAHGQKLEAFPAVNTTSNALDVIVCFSDQSLLSQLAAAPQRTLISNSAGAVEVCAGPDVGFVRCVFSISVLNNDSAASTFHLRYSSGGDVVTATLSPGDHLEYTNNGWRVSDSNGSQKTGSVQDLSAYLTISGATSLYQPLDGELTALAGLTSAADKVPYFTGSDAAALADFTAAGRALVAGANVAAQRATLGLGTAALAATGDFDAAGAAAAAQAASESYADAGDATTLASANAHSDALIVDSIADTDATHAPSRNAVFDALALKANLASPALSGTPTTPTAAAATNTTQIASTAFVHTEVSNAVTGLLHFQGATDCSTNPNYPAAVKGDSYIVSVAGKIGGASGTSVDVGDWYIASADNAGGTEASVGTSWAHLEHNLVGALLAANNLSDLASATTALTNLGLSANGKSLVTAANYAAMRTLLGLVIGTDVQAHSAALDAVSGTNTGDETATTVAAILHAAASKATPVDADELPLVDSAASNVLKKLTWANLKATLKTYLDTLYQVVLVSGTNIKTINSTSLLGSGDIAISATPAGSGTELQYRNAGAFGAMSGTAWDDTNRAETRTGATVTTSNPVQSFTQIWNDASVQFTGWKLNITSTASDLRSRLFAYQIGGVEALSMHRSGWLNLGATVNASGVPTTAGIQGNPGGNGGLAFTANGVPWGWFSGVDFRTYASGLFAWSSDLTTAVAGRDTALARNAAGVVEVNNGTAGTFRDLKLRNLLPQVFTVATLPSASTQGNGACSHVSDASAPTFGATVSSGGAVSTPVYSDATNWKVG